MKRWLSVFGHAAGGAAVMTGTMIMLGGGPITAGAVLIPALITGAVAGVSKASPSPFTQGLVQLVVDQLTKKNEK